MNHDLLRIAELLFRGDPAEIAGVRDAFANPAAFIARYGGDLGYVRPKPGWFPEPWSLLLDFAQLRGWVQVVDWRAGSDEVAASAAVLVPATAISADWNKLAASHEETETREFLRVIARTVPSRERLVSLDDGSDSYPLALILAGSLAEMQQLAKTVGGRLEVLDA